MKSSFLFAIFLLFAGSAFSQVRVGNGGEGTREVVPGKLIVFDLIYTGNYENPYIGKNVDPVFYGSLLAHRSLREAGVDLGLLAAKLTDLEQVSPRFGEMILTVFEQLNFQLLMGSEARLEQHYAPNFGEMLERRRGQVPTELLAVRQNSTVFIDGNLWQELDAVNRVALLIHEGVYALVKRSCEDDFGREPICFQQYWDAWSIVGKLFSEEESKHTEIQNEIFSNLNIPVQGSLFPSALCVKKKEYRLEGDYREEAFSIELEPFSCR